MKKVAVILNGCGHRDGSEIHEAVLALLAIEEAGATWECLALDKNQAGVVDHITGDVLHEEGPGKSALAGRNMLHESARIARGRIKNLATARAHDYAAVIIPGGNGTAKNLCNFATSDSAMTVDPDLERFLREAHGAAKRSPLPIGAICIAPIILAKLFGAEGVELTLGSTTNDAAKAAQKMGAKLVPCEASQCHVDARLKIVTTPAYMCDASVAEVAAGIRQLAQQVLALHLIA